MPPTIDDITKGLVIAMFPKIEHVYIDVIPADTFSHAMRCHKLKSIEVISGFGVSLTNIAGLLHLPYLERLGSTYEFRQDSGSLDSVLACSSSIRDLSIYQNQEPITVAHVDREVVIMDQLLSKFNNLKSLRWSKEVHDGRTGERLESALSLVKASLEDFSYQISVATHRQFSNEAILGALREYPILKSLNLPLQLLLPMNNTQQSHISSSLPSMLEQLELRAEHLELREERPLKEFNHERWLAITRSIMRDRARLSALAQITLRVPSSLFRTRGATLDAIKKLCEDAGVELKVEWA